MKNGSGKPKSAKPKIVEHDPSAPVPYNDCPQDDFVWNADPGDEVLPSRKGFITDCVFRHRGKEITTLFTIWSTLFILSSAVKREAWIRFGTKRLWTNFYCVLIGPAGIAHKTEAINDAVDLLEKFQEYIADPDMKIMKTINIVSDKASPEALLESLHPKNRPPFGVQGFWFKDAEGKQKINPDTGRGYWYAKTAEAAIVAHEFSTLAGNQKYNTGLTDNLLALYDCDRPFSWRTVKRKKVELKYLHTTLLAGTTLTSFRMSVTEGTRSDGFLSRTVIVNCPRTEGRRFSRPKRICGAPNQDELAERLHWIALNSIGEFDLSTEADKFYDHWYNKWRDELESDVQLQGMKSRMNVLVLKVALLYRLQRYDSRDKIIDLQDLKDAITLVRRTWFEAIPIARGFDSDVKPIIGRLEEYIRSHNGATRTQLMRQAKFSAQDLSDSLSVLVDEGKIEVYWDDELRAHPSTNSKEKYKWCGERWLGAGFEEE
jgi:hypothetical protein